MLVCSAFVLSLAHLFSRVFSYNVDTKFPIIFYGPAESYFGYTVALHRNRNGAMAIVGAPLANSSILADQLYQPGALFKCDMRKSCEEIILDKKGNTHVNTGVNEAHHDNKDSMWLGVSLDILQNSIRNDIVTCGHLWKNQQYKHHYLVNGACYVINSDLETESTSKLVPFVDITKQANSSRGIYYYAFGQVGTSAAFSQDGNYLHLGAPGFYDWTGTVVSYKLNSDNLYQEYKKPSVPDPPEQNLTPESYIGYSVTSGKFYDDNDEYVAVGAPRDGDFCGRVYIYKAMKTSDKKMVVHQRKNGVQLGEYFGGTVLAMNLNGDSYTDLLVAAPLHSLENGVDEGKVYVFISNGLGLQNFAELIGKNRAYARFGSAIADLGDINQDGYNDIAIGAPYEEEKGAIYIYHGSLSGMNVDFVQRIAAKDIDTNLEGFGIHISRGFDIDSNQYPDVLVGAYASSNAVLFRTQPVVQLSSKLIFSPKQINTNVTNCEYQGGQVSCVNVTACLWYAAKHFSLNLEFTHEIFLEHPTQGNFISNQGFFFKNGKVSTALTHKSKLEIGKDSCITETIYIRPDIKDVITPIQVLYRFSLISDDSSIQFKNFPVIDPLSPNNITSSVSFLTGCGADDKCLSDLLVRSKVIGLIDNTPLIIGKNSTLSLSIEVVNLGEPAYLSELLIFLPPEIPSINHDTCSTSADSQNLRNNATLTCDIGNPLLKDQKVNFLIKLDLTKIPTDRKQVFIYVEAITASNEVNPSDNKHRLSLNFKAIADISITGTPTQEQIQFDEKTEVFMPLYVTHTFFVMNHGPSPLQIVDINLSVPTSFKRENREETFGVLIELEADSGKPLTIPAKCNDTNLVIKRISPEVKKIRDDIFGEKELIEQSRQNDSSFLSTAVDEFNSRDVITSRLKRSIFKKTSPQRKTDVVLSCETVDCVQIQCSASPFSDTRKFARITVTVEVNISILNEFFNPWYRIEYVTSGEVSMRKTSNNLFLKQHHPDRTEVRTVIIHSGPLVHEKVDQWIIFVSIGIGVLLLLIILILLIKFGFFRRKQKEEMEKMKTKGDTKNYDPCDDESTESEALN